MKLSSNKAQNVLQMNTVYMNSRNPEVQMTILQNYATKFIIDKIKEHSGKSIIRTEGKQILKTEQTYKNDA